jgi:hypothetical protein
MKSTGSEEVTITLFDYLQACQPSPDSLYSTNLSPILHKLDIREN